MKHYYNESKPITAHLLHPKFMMRLVLVDGEIWKI